MATEKRLIDANALVVFLKDQREKETGAYSKGRNNGLNVSISATQNEEICPAVDAVEVVHGRWVIEKRHTISRNPYMDDNYHAHATCSECGFCIHSENASFGYPKMNTTNYCPNCGAKMDGDGNDI